MKNTLRTVAIGLVPFLPFIAYAIEPSFEWVVNVTDEAADTVGQFIPILIGIALIVFIWGVVKFVAADDDNGRADGRRRIVWGLIGLFVVISIWGLVQLIQELFGIQGEQLVEGDLPCIPTLDC